MGDQVTIGLVGFCAIVAAWDSARRYFEVRRFNQTILDNQARIERDHADLAKKVHNIGEKLSLNLGATAGRTPRIGGMR